MEFQTNPRGVEATAGGDSGAEPDMFQTNPRGVEAEDQPIRRG